MRFFLRVFIVLLLFISCKNSKKVDVSNIKINFKIDRYEVDFYASTLKEYPKLKKKYPYLFPKQFSDSLAFVKMKDKDEQELFLETQKIYKDFSDVSLQLKSLFSHIKYYSPKYKSPNVTTIISNIDYDRRVIYADSLLLISLDVYLGKEHPFYADYPKYIKENNTEEHIVVDVAKSIIDRQIASFNNRTFINKMINEGKKLYLLDAYLPTVSDKNKIGYVQKKLDWAITNEEQTWMYFIEKKILFSTDTKLNKRFLDNAPFSKFYLQYDNLSPGKIGVWVGWQIVKSYMKHNDVSLQELLKIDSEELFKKSKYKPKR
ncbi:MAG: gliding motility lipoprotein GldB [Polaribacter sp.]